MGIFAGEAIKVESTEVGDRGGGAAEEAGGRGPLWEDVGSI